ncbi:lysophospholipid acyltransferase family protein [Spirochaeta africana]|uniref:1-acyl-sn-glycerol-3-phosphate acyltransferase n=1 Tax=Spirochaeta africana (strain ATCC 700263 / DSM 8902 / Z-7692) TaxID=889378 RepID=H9UHZ1_SPIAZ|nr:lysophospholipid acyltransferase family protein [Spirochaeta africana]AFG37134.1 1-acyl-sn-glycerol-3-phosphate acyltransferase [Spirochaeta africana DSM 8902]
MKPLQFLLSLLISLFVWVFCILIAIPLFLTGIIILGLTLPFDRRRRVLHQYSCFWASIYTWINPFWAIHITGRENIRPDTPYMIISNHQSLVDILVLYRLFKHFKWVAKAELFKIPVFGWHMALNRYIRLDRMDRRSQFKMLKTAIRTVEQGSSVLIFPEGTRTADGTLRRFKEGAFVIAQKAKVPIVPIVINGSFASLPKSSFIMRHRVHIHVTVLPEIPVEQVTAQDTKALAEQAQDLIQQHLQEA